MMLFVATHVYVNEKCYTTAITHISRETNYLIVCDILFSNHDTLFRRYKSYGLLSLWLYLDFKNDEKLINFNICKQYLTSKLIEISF